MDHDDRKRTPRGRRICIVLGGVFVVPWLVFVFSRFTDEDFTNPAAYIFALIVAVFLAFLPVFIVHLATKSSDWFDRLDADGFDWDDD